MFSKEAMRARYIVLAEQAAAISAISDPLRAKRDALVAEVQPRERALHEQIVAAETGLYDIRQEMAFLARGLGSETPALT